ncbi:MAG: glycosyltransferase family 4 protein [bacterium]
MRIVQVNKFFYLRGGSERYYFDLCALLESRDHKILHFSMHHLRNRQSDQQAYFVSNIDLNSPMSALGKIRAAARIIYSNEAKRNFSKLIDDFKPDIIHFHNITRQISPSVIDVGASKGIPMIQTVHDLYLLCPAHSFYVNQHVCELCKEGSYWHCIVRKCIDGKLSSSILGSIESYLHSWLGLYKKIAKMITPSLFLKKKIEVLKWTAEKTVHLPYFIPWAPDYSNHDDGYVLFAGRISDEKGVGTVIEAAKLLRDIRFVIAGEGPRLQHYREMVSLFALSNVSFKGYADSEMMENLLKGASCVIMPSVSYENLPLIILEAFARGKPVVGSNCGGIPEMVKDGETGFLFKPADGVSLAECLQRITRDSDLRKYMGRKARELVNGIFSPDFHYSKLIEIYESVR